MASLIASTNDALVSLVGSVGTTATAITSTVGVAAQAIDMAAIKVNVVHAGVLQTAVIDREEQQQALIMDRAKAQLKRLEDQARILGQTINKADTYNKLVTKYTALLNPTTTSTSD